MSFVSYSVNELYDPIKIESSVIAYDEVQIGMQRNQSYMQNVERVRLGLQLHRRLRLQLRRCGQLA